MNTNALILELDAYRGEAGFDRNAKSAASGMCVVIPFPVLAKPRQTAKVARATNGLKPRIARARNLSRAKKSLTA